MSSAHDAALFIIENNARGQAKSDAYSMSLLDAIKYVNDPNTVVNAMEVLKHWANTYDTSVLFTGLNTYIYNQLTEDEVSRLVNHWTNLYPAYVVEFLRRRLDGD